jgi:hypothetical protein
MTKLEGLQGRVDRQCGTLTIWHAVSYAEAEDHSGQGEDAASVFGYTGMM